MSASRLASRLLAAAAACAILGAAAIDLTRRDAAPDPPSLPLADGSAPSGRRPWFRRPLPFDLVEASARAGLTSVHQKVTPHPALGNLGPWLASLGAAVAVVDFDEDGWQDVYLTNSAVGSRNRLFRNNHDGTFTDMAGHAGLADLNGDAGSLRPLFFDFDNDGHKDLLLTTHRCAKLLRNGGDGTFTDVTARSGLRHCGIAMASNAFDYDGDGRLDLIIGNYMKEATDYFDPKDFRIMFRGTAGDGNGGRAAVYHNDGGGKFSPARGNLGIRDPRWNLAIGVYDLRGTGRPDLHFALDYNLGRLYLNDNGRYTDASAELSDTLSMSGMCSEFGDPFNAGRPDLFVTYIASLPADEKNAYWRMLPNGHFENASERLGVSRCGWAWGAKFVDLDNDSLQDLVVVNGFLSADPKKNYFESISKTGPSGPWMEDVRNWPPVADSSLAGYQRNCVFRNTGSRFEEVVARTGMKDDLYDGRGVALIDVMNDGRLSLVVANQGQPVGFYRGEHRNRNHWIGFELRGTRSNRDAFGAEVKVRLRGGKVLTRQLQPANGFMSQSDPRLHFGLGPRPEIERAWVRWPAGGIQELGSPALDRYHPVVEPAADGRFGRITP